MAARPMCVLGDFVENKIIMDQKDDFSDIDILAY